ncbi:phosphate butyryltransferase [Clostridium sp. FAM 1755]|jgi:phosphate butyryltransferase|uniref:Phosphate butyryltransferase n=2 Tax=Clostridium TaxID=1485 RepID=A0A6M0SUH4_CLOBO|nr:MULTISPECIES: phosphate butyryltransferase [Clostridium]NFA59209.1 phosphate butyryltransferase [Clostridium botulinum]KOR24506.1 phosphate butyryltransferase [Clostridium sp. L74]MDS1003717.1 phosphate butyryltransferase [Clostridium sporogenes]NFI74816.1 phosphate butyryltransferase [Clostridium sporogenes]NFL71051.1 phosphate butyryltransferase [Clostridium sporogenes]
MIKSFDEILQKAKSQEKRTISVAVAQDKHVLEAIKDAKEQGLVNAILVGNSEKIEEIAKQIGMKLEDYEIISENDNRKAALKAVEIVSSGKADMVMKGLIDTANFLRAVLNKEIGLRTGKIMSHIAVFEVKKLEKLIMITDSAFNMYPGLEEKIDIVKNAVTVAHSIGIETPKVAPICAVEVVNPKMPATLDAATLSKMNDRGQIKGCIIDGPLALDNAISEEAAAHKGINSPVAGNANIFLMPNIEAGNVMYKTLTYAADCKNAGLLVGTSAPVVLTSRSDSHESKLNAIALAALVASQLKK